MPIHTPAELKETAHQKRGPSLSRCQRRILRAFGPGIRGPETQKTTEQTGESRLLPPVCCFTLVKHSGCVYSIVNPSKSFQDFRPNCYLLCFPFLAQSAVPVRTVPAIIIAAIQTSILLSSPVCGTSAGFSGSGFSSGVVVPITGISTAAF